MSWRIIGEDLARAWQDIAGGRPVELDEVPTSFRTWSNAIATARFDAEVPYWTEVLSTLTPTWAAVRSTRLWMSRKPFARTVSRCTPMSVRRCCPRCLRRSTAA